MIHVEFGNSYLKRSEKQAKCTEIILGHVASYQESGQTDAETVFAAALHVNMLSHDVLSLLLLHSITDDKWTSRTAARMAATVMFEGADDLQHIFGRPFREACSNLGILEVIEGDLARVRTELTAFQQKHNPVLKPIRMAAGAHRDHDITKFLGAFVDESQSNSVVNAVGDLETCLRNWGIFCTDVMVRVKEAINAGPASDRC